MVRDVAHLAVVDSDWAVGVHGDGDRLQVLKSILTENGVDIGTLGEMDGTTFSVAFDLDAEQPVEFAQISNVHML